LVKKQEPIDQSGVAEAFSSGRFELTYDYMADGITWYVVGENIFSGKKAVLANCEQTAAYVRSIATVFKPNHIIAGKNRVAINGTAEFIRNNKQVAFVAACDVYEFNEKGLLQSITSCCIPEKKIAIATIKKAIRS